jgi:hypothetical protein
MLTYLSFVIKHNLYNNIRLKKNTWIIFLHLYKQQQTFVVLQIPVNNHYYKMNLQRLYYKNLFQLLVYFQQYLYKNKMFEDKVQVQ